MLHLSAVEEVLFLSLLKDHFLSYYYSIQSLNLDPAKNLAINFYLTCKFDLGEQSSRNRFAAFLPLSNA